MVKHLQEKHFDPVWHAHAEYQLFVVLQGTGTRFVGDSIKSFAPGELIFTGPHVPHLWRSDEAYFAKQSGLQTEGIVIYLDEHFLGEQMLEKEELLALKKLFIRSGRGLEFYGETRQRVVALMQELTGMRGLTSVIQLLKIVSELAGSRQYRYISSVAFADAINEDETDRVNQVYDYVIKNFRQRISLEEVSALVHLTPTSFSRYFTRKNNRSFSKFVAEIRIRHACKLIAETDHTMEHICYECGFNTLSNFNRQFKEQVGEQPGQYRKKIRSL